MTCASCANRIERRLNKLDGVTATVNYATEKATVDFDPAAVVARGARRGRRGRRLRGRAARRRAEPEATPARTTRTPRCAALIVSLALSVPVLLMSMIPALQFDNWQWLSLQPRHAGRVLWGAWPFHRAAWANLKPRRGDDGHADLASARSPPGCGRSTRCSSATPA